MRTMPYRDHDDVSVLRARHDELVRDLRDVEARLHARRAIVRRAWLGVAVSLLAVMATMLALGAMALRPRSCTRRAGADAAWVRDAVEMYCVEHPAAVCPTFDDLVDERIFHASHRATAPFVIVCERGRCADARDTAPGASSPSRIGSGRGTP